MIGQWVGRVEGEIPGTLRIETEDRGFGLIGRAYLFYDDPNLPGYLFDINLPKGQPLQAKLATIYLYPAGGIMSAQDRQGAEAYLVSNYGGAMPSHLDVEFSIVGLDLIVAWAQPEPVSADKPSGVKRFLRLVQKQGDDDGPQRGNVTLRMSDPAGASVLTPRPDLVSWDQFRHWAAGQHPRHYIFRGQRQPFKLATTFHRTWRKNLNQWITQDIELLFGSVAETLKYPLQLVQRVIRRVQPID